jgi:hypothetical protein
MNFNLKRSSIICVALGMLLLAYGIYQTQKNTSIEPNLNARIDLTAFEQTSALQDFQTLLDNEETLVWQEIERASGMSKKQIIALKSEKSWQKYYAEDIKNLKEKKQSDQTISPKTMQFIKQMFDLCGLDSNKVEIVSSNGFSPAAATDIVLFINPEKFDALSPNIQKFVLVHEMSHIINQDHSTRFILEDMQENQKDNERLEHAINHIKYFSETRADVFAILQGQEFAQGQIEFMEQCLKLHGNKPGRSHPSNGERLAMGQKLLALIEHKNNSQA